jgi:ligand-binding sensor domain-containing protein
MNLLKALTIIIILFLTQSVFAQWSNSDFTLTGRQIQCFAYTNSTILSGTDQGLVRSTNNGANWVSAGSGLPYTNIRALILTESSAFNLLAGMVSGRISMSTNYGDDWTAFPSESEQLPFLANIYCILERSNSSNYLVGTERGVYLLPQYYPLSTWIPINTGLPSSETKVKAIVENNGEVFVGTNSGVFQLSGSSWDDKSFGLTNTNVTALTSLGGNLFAGTNQGSVGGIYISSDNGNNWTLSLTDPWISSFLTVGSNIFAGSVGNGIWRSTNYGNSWSQINDGLGSGAYNVLSLDADEQYLFAGTVSSSIWRRPLSQVVTDVNEHKDSQPSKFSLEQNYPNPFNPSTKIKYSIPNVTLSGVEGSRVQLKVYDILGKEVADLVNENQPAGSYEVTFDASRLTSGVYFYKLQAGSFTETKNMILVR